MDFYKDSWAIYKAHSEGFQDDFQYYYDFCKGYKSLEICAGYGRVSNFLNEKGIDLHANELSSSFASFISLPKNKINVGDVLTLNMGQKFDRIFAAYNSFCLFSNEDDLRKLFSNLAAHLAPKGQISLNYYHPNCWHQAASYHFDFQGSLVNYIPSFDLSQKEQRLGTWKDRYEQGSNSFEHSYDIRLFFETSEVEAFLTHTRLKIVKEVHNFGAQKTLEPGWIDYILELE